MHALKNKDMQADISRQKLVINPQRFLKLLEQADKSRQEVQMMMRSLDKAENA